MKSEKIQPNRKFTVVGGDSLRQILMSNLGQVRTVIREAYIAHDQGRTVNPHSVFLNFDESPNRIIALPAYVATTARAGVKWISSFPGNIDVGIPRASAVLILNEVSTGTTVPVCCFSGLLSAGWV